MTTAEIPQLRGLSRDEKMSLAGQLWDEIVAAADELPLTARLDQIVEDAADEHARDSRGGTPWAEAKARILRAAP